ncbi:hypothetical protein [Enterococcus sp.]|uniref:hypothetical protein n=1 Tax=Enterococcus sp. TaxID=35783 RepID=UPI003C7537B2
MSKKIRCWVDFGTVGKDYEEILEVPDGFSDERITREVEEYFMKYVKVGWEDEED